MAELIASEGKMCYLYKLDLARAYRQLPSDPLVWPLLGAKLGRRLLVDKSIPFGLRHGAMNCERVTCSICYAVRKKLIAKLEAYIEDMGGVAPNNLKVAQQ